MPISSASFARTTLLLLFIGALSVLAIVCMSVWMVGRTTSYADEVVQARTARVQLVRLFGLMQDAETGQRGYLLVGDPLYLEPFEAARVDIPGAVKTIRPAFAAWPDKLRAVDRLTEIATIRLSELQRTIDLAQAGDREAALNIVRRGSGQTLMDETRERFSNLLSSIDARLGVLADEMRWNARALIWVTLAGGILVLTVVVGSGWIIVRYTRDLEVARHAVATVNAELEERVRERTIDLARANDEIQRFAYIVSHDLRSPLVNIMGFTGELEASLAALRSYIERHPADDADPVEMAARATVNDDLPEAIGFIRSSTSKMDELINAILKLSREGRRVLRPEPVSVTTLVDTAVSSVQHQLSAASGEATIEGPLPDVITDRLALEQVFGNLIDNAVKYLDPSRPGRITIRGSQSRLGVLYEVEDNGRGIAKQDHERVFELFRRAGPQDRPGDGIGLAHVRTLVRRLGGEISVHSEPGKGSTFSVSLPRDLRAFLGVTRV